jgi:DNA-binding response OmpR family regulator/Tfp pilus assembly protein PilZ
VPREPRIVTSLRVEFSRLGERVGASTEDISRHGVFVRTSDFLPVGNVVELTLHLPRGGALNVISRVAHILSDRAARALSRRAGMGFEFLEQDESHRVRLESFLVDLLQELTPPPRELPNVARVLVADPSPRLRERLATALGENDFDVETVGNGAEAYSACLEQAPDVLLVADEMPVMDGWTLVKMLATKPRLADVPVALMSDDSSDITRLRAYRLGVKDFLQRPFTDEEVCIRLRRLALNARPASERITLRGNLAEIGFGTLLSLLEFERKSGILAVLSDAEVARLFVAQGRIVKVESTAAPTDAAVKDRLMRVLDWHEGNFEFSACEVVGADEVQMSTQYLLIEHARVRDEAENSGDAPPSGKDPSSDD